MIEFPEDRPCVNCGISMYGLVIALMPWIGKGSSWIGFDPPYNLSKISVCRGGEPHNFRK